MGWGDTVIKDAVTSRDMPALSFSVPCLGAEIGVQGEGGTLR